MDKSSLVAVGKAVRTHGTRGALKVLAYGETLGEMEAGEKLFSVEGGGQRQLTLVSLNAQKRVMIVEFEEIGSMDQAGVNGKGSFH